MASQDIAQTSGHHNIVNGTHEQLILFLTLNIWTSHVGLPILLAIVIFSKKIQRHPTFLNMCLTFIVIGISSSILVYAGKATGPEPPMMLCLFQASLLYGMPALSSLAVFMLVFQMFLVIRSTLKKEEMPQRSLFRRWGVLIVPWVAWMASILATASVGASNPDNVSRNRRFFYCSVRSDPLTNTIMVIAALVLIATLVFEVWSVVLFWTNLRGKGSASLTGLRVSMELNLAIRVLAFGLYIMIALSLSLLSISTPESPIPDLVIASAATVVILIFGTQRDIIRACCFWRKDAARSKGENNSYIREIDTPVVGKAPDYAGSAMFARLARFYR